MTACNQLRHKSHFLCAWFMQRNQIHDIFYNKGGKLHLNQSFCTRHHLEFFLYCTQASLSNQMLKYILKDDHSWSPLQTCCCNQTSRQGHVQKSFKQVHHNCWIIYDYMPSTQTHWQRKRGLEEELPSQEMKFSLPKPHLHLASARRYTNTITTCYIIRYSLLLYVSEKGAKSNSSIGT